MVALIERNREGEVYYLFPGGHVEEGETLEQAAAREAQEELGLDVEVGRLIADVVYQGNRQVYFAASVKGGSFGSGTGPEFSAELHAGATFIPVWLPIRELANAPVYPEALRRLVAGCEGAWPDEALVVSDPGRAANQR